MKLVGYEGGCGLAHARLGRPKAWTDDKLPFDRFLSEMSEHANRFTADHRNGRCWGCTVEEPETGRVDPKARSGYGSERNWLERSRSSTGGRVDEDLDAEIRLDPEIRDWLACELMQSTQISCCRLEEPMPEPWKCC